MSQGFPDFGRQTHTQVSPTISFSETVSAETSTVYYYVGDLPYLEIAWDCTGLSDYYLVQLSFADDVNGNTFAGSSSVVTVPLQTGWISYKSKGIYAQLIVDNKQATDTGPITIYVRGSTSESGRYDNAYQAIPLLAYNADVTASGNATITAATTIAGEACLSIWHNSSALWHATMQYWDWSSALWVSYTHIYGADYGQSMIRMVKIPAAPIRMIIYNDDTATQLMVLGLVT